MSAQEWRVFVALKPEDHKAEEVVIEDNLDWYAVAMAGERAMSGAPNGSCEVTLMRGQEHVVSLFPKGRDSERRAWAMAEAITQLRAEVLAARK